MPARIHVPTGAACWADLWTSDVEGSRSFYSELFGWEAGEPSPEFGGYFMFLREGAPVAGGMGDMGEMKADNSWKIYLATPDNHATVAAAQTKGATVAAPIMEVADLGSQAVLVDPTGATLGTWQAGSFPGFMLLGEHGTPSWFELFTRDYATAVNFYTSVFGLEASVMSDSESFRYTTLREPGTTDELAGVMDAAATLPEGAPSNWTVYWESEDTRAAVATVRRLGGSVIADAQDTPFGVVATVTDPTGATFKLHTGHA